MGIRRLRTATPDSPAKTKGRGQDGRRQGPVRWATGQRRETETREVAARDHEMAETCERDSGGGWGERGSRAWSADPTAPRYNVSGGGGGELKASGREIKTNTEMRGANGGGG